MPRQLFNHLINKPTFPQYMLCFCVLGFPIWVGYSEAISCSNPINHSFAFITYYTSNQDAFYYADLAISDGEDITIGPGSASYVTCCVEFTNSKKEADYTLEYLTVIQGNEIYDAFDEAELYRATLGYDHGVFLCYYYGDGQGITEMVPGSVCYNSNIRKNGITEIE